MRGSVWSRRGPARRVLRACWLTVPTSVPHGRGWRRSSRTSSPVMPVAGTASSAARSRWLAMCATASWSRKTCAGRYGSRTCGHGSVSSISTSSTTSRRWRSPSSFSLRDSMPVIDTAGSPGPAVVLGPGTGLGCAVLMPGGHRATVLPSEAGHVALAPGNEREIEVLRRLGRDRPYVHVGHVLSGPGLVNLHRALAEIEGIASPLVEPAQISAAAVHGNDPLARGALTMFCALLGSFAGDLAVIFKASAGVYLAGGILPAIRDFLLASDFRVRFLNKGLMRPFLANVPVRLLEHGQLGVIGAAAMQIDGAAGPASGRAGHG